MVCSDLVGRRKSTLSLCYNFLIIIYTGSSCLIDLSCEVFTPILKFFKYSFVQFDQHSNVLNWADFGMYRNLLSISDYWIKGYLHWGTGICYLIIFGGLVPFFELMELFNTG